MATIGTSAEIEIDGGREAADASAPKEHSGDLAAALTLLREGAERGPVRHVLPVIREGDGDLEAACPDPQPIPPGALPGAAR